jgi:hypothetical protein
MTTLSFTPTPARHLASTVVAALRGTWIAQATRDEIVVLPPGPQDWDYLDRCPDLPKEMRRFRYL